MLEERRRLLKKLLAETAELHRACGLEYLTGLIAKARRYGVEVPEELTQYERMGCCGN